MLSYFTNYTRCTLAGGPDVPRRPNQEGGGGVRVAIRFEWLHKGYQIHQNMQKQGCRWCFGRKTCRESCVYVRFLLKTNEPEFCGTFDVKSFFHSLHTWFGFYPRRVAQTRGKWWVLFLLTLPCLVYPQEGGGMERFSYRRSRGVRSNSVKGTPAPLVAPLSAVCLFEPP